MSKSQFLLLYGVVERAGRLALSGTYIMGSLMGGLQCRMVILRNAPVPVKRPDVVIKRNTLYVMSFIFILLSLGSIYVAFRF